jgi:carbon monoxide dehydrogenase subunit G
VLLKGSLSIPDGSDRVWDFVSDPAKVIQCVPGLQSYTVGEGKRVSASVKVSVGFIRGTFQTVSRIIREDKSAKVAVLELTGSGAGSGFSAVVTLSVSGNSKESQLTWEADAKVSGPLGSLAKPLIEGNIRKIVDQLFDCVKAKLG